MAWADAAIVDFAQALGPATAVMREEFGSIRPNFLAIPQLVLLGPGTQRRIIRAI